MHLLVVVVVTVASFISSCDGFATPVPNTSVGTHQQQQSSSKRTTIRLDAGAVDNESSSSNKSQYELPEIQGDFDWDSKFAGDPDWITEDVPGKIVMNEIDLAAQITALNRMEEAYKKQRLQREYEESKTVGWVASAELLNGRTAMFFLVTGLLTELWTGISMPGQVEEMLRIGGFIGFD